MKVNWTVQNIPRLNGKTAIVTGANSGIGFETARALAGAEAEVILAVRDEKKGREALNRIQASIPSAKIQMELLDLASLESVVEFSKRIANRNQPIDILINNAGIMAVPTRHTTKDGFELQFATNFLGHFALTGRLLPLLLRSNSPRVVSLSSSMNRRGKIDFEDLQSETRYDSMKAYRQSKLATLTFAIELNRLSQKNSWGIRSNSAHPGFTRTNLQTSGPSLGRKNQSGSFWMNKILFMSQTAPEGALPTLFAATSALAIGGGYYGPGGWFELTAVPAPAKIPSQALDENVASRLWKASEQLTGVHY